MFLAGLELWKRISAAARVARGRRYVATPYLTAGVARNLRFQRGDVLLCGLSLANCRNGSIDPREVRRLQRKGVRVYALDQLHAKVFLLGRRAVVGSANLTKRSLTLLDEAAVLVSDAPSLRDIRSWFEARLHSPVQSEWLAACLRAYRPPTAVSRGSRKAKQRMTAERPRGVLVASLIPRIDSEQEEKLVEEAEIVARRRLAHPRLSDVENVRWSGQREFRRGDEIIQVLRDDGDVWVYPHAKVIHVRKVQRKVGRSRSYVFLEMPRSYRRLRFKDFAKKCRHFGLALKERSTRQITDPIIVHQLLMLTSPEKPRRGR